MFVFMNEKGEYCIRKVGEEKVESYLDFRLFVSDLKVCMENEKEISDSAAVTKENKGTPNRLEAVERRCKPDRTPYSFT